MYKYFERDMHYCKKTLTRILQHLINSANPANSDAD